MKYYRATNQRLIEKLKKLSSDAQATQAARLKLADELGFDACVHWGSWNRSWGFTKPRDASKVPTALRKSKKHGFYLPANSKAGRELNARMDSAEYRIPGSHDVHEIVKYNRMEIAPNPHGTGVMIISVGFIDCGRDGLFLRVPAESKFVPKGCRRATDVEYELALAREEKRRANRNLKRQQTGATP